MSHQRTLIEQSLKQNKQIYKRYEKTRAVSGFAAFSTCVLESSNSLIISPHIVPFPKFWADGCFWQLHRVDLDCSEIYNCVGAERDTLVLLGTEAMQ